MLLFSHHFGYQCKVQTYGFSRLIDLLEELSHIVKVRMLNSVLRFLLFFIFCSNE